MPCTGPDWICGVQPGSVGSEVSQIIPSETSDGAGHDMSRVRDVSRVRPTVPFSFSLELGLAEANLSVGRRGQGREKEESRRRDWAEPG